MTADVIVVGDGPAGLQCALLLAKNEMDVHVFGEDETYLHDAYLYNYLGIEAIHGSEFAEIGRAQCEKYGAELHETTVESAEATDDGYRVTTSAGETHTAERLVLTEGDSREVARSLDLETDEDGVVQADKHGNTSRENVYAGGWTSRDNRIQAAVSVGDGAAIALTILSEEHGRQFHDFDVPEE